MSHEIRTPHARHTGSFDTCSGHANHRSAATGTTGAGFGQPPPGGNNEILAVSRLEADEMAYQTTPFHLAETC